MNDPKTTADGSTELVPLIVRDGDSPSEVIPPHSPDRKDGWIPATTKPDADLRVIGACFDGEVDGVMWDGARWEWADRLISRPAVEFWMDYPCHPGECEVKRSTSQGNVKDNRS